MNIKINVNMEAAILQSELNAVRSANGWKLIVVEEDDVKYFFFEKGGVRQLICKEAAA